MYEKVILLWSPSCQRAITQFWNLSERKRDWTFITHLQQFRAIQHTLFLCTYFRWETYLGKIYLCIHIYDHVPMPPASIVYDDLTLSLSRKWRSLGRGQGSSFFLSPTCLSYCKQKYYYTPTEVLIYNLRDVFGKHILLIKTNDSCNERSPPQNSIW